MFASRRGSLSAPATKYGKFMLSFYSILYKCVHVQKLMWGISDTTALSLAGNGTVVAEKCSSRSTLLPGFLYHWTPCSTRMFSANWTTSIQFVMRIIALNTLRTRVFQSVLYRQNWWPRGAILLAGWRILKILTILLFLCMVVKRCLVVWLKIMHCCHLKRGSQGNYSYVQRPEMGNGRNYMTNNCSFRYY
jgi:hypothetical protein